jgi:hypothetical protein
MIINSDENPEDGNWMFRCESCHIYTLRVDIYCNSFRVVSTTPKGKWIVYNWVHPTDEESTKLYKKFVRNNGKKRYAHETREGAKIAFIARKQRQVELLKAQLEKAEMSYVAAGGTLPIKTRKFRSFEDY